MSNSSRGVVLSTKDLLPRSVRACWDIADVDVLGKDSVSDQVKVLQL
jgi:hypothetical protein